MGSVCRNKGPDNEPGNENAKQNKTGRNAFVAEPGLCLLKLLAGFQRLSSWLSCLGLWFPAMLLGSPVCSGVVGRGKCPIWGLAGPHFGRGAPPSQCGCEQGDALGHLLGLEPTAGDTSPVTGVGPAPFPAHAG